jgi:8-oxo-dGTP pyrophosphatase MutT (NUDIX family)
VASQYPSRQFAADEFVESAGAVVFDFSRKQICLIHHVELDQWLLPKGRRNCSEHCFETAVREVKEETGYHVSIVPVRLKTRAPLAHEGVAISDEAREYENIDDPFSLTVRELGDNNIKLVWWFIAKVLSDSRPNTRSLEDEHFEAHLFDFETAIQILTFDGDREIARRAIDLVTATYF